MDTQTQDNSDTPTPKSGASRRSRLNVAVRITLDRGHQEFDVVTHDLSSGGLGADMPFQLVPGETLTVELPHYGKVGGRIAWVVGTRFGIAFADVVDISSVAPRSGKTPRTAAGEVSRVRPTTSR